MPYDTLEIAVPCDRRCFGDRPDKMANTTRKRWLRATLLIVAIGGISLLHYNTPTSHYWTHPLLQRAYYLPVLLMALWFGWRGGIAAAALAALSYIPHIAMAWESQPEYRAAGYIEIGMYFVIGGLTGVLADLERAQKRKIEATATQLAETYAELQSSMEQLRRADRLSALGELSAGLAHEIRNPLGSLDGAVEILRRPELPEQTRQEFAEMAGKEVFRLKGLLTNFLEFARPQAPRRTLIEPQLLLESVAQLAGETAKMARVTICIEPASMAAVSVDAEQIKQVLLNLVLNAVQAMPAGGAITLRSRSGNGSVLLEVADQGIGIPEETQERIFDPFFTTRAGGTGLGLSIAYQIINRHGGHISVRNNPVRGVTFTVVLPVSQCDVGNPSIASALL